MLSADPLPFITVSRFEAQTVHRASGSIHVPAHHLLVTLDSFATTRIYRTPGRDLKLAFFTPEPLDSLFRPSG
jgi:hypothetical protein